jgi:hypothetical protein
MDELFCPPIVSLYFMIVGSILGQKWSGHNGKEKIGSLL